MEKDEEEGGSSLGKKRRGSFLFSVSPFFSNSFIFFTALFPPLALQIARACFPLRFFRVRLQLCSGTGRDIKRIPSANETVL